MQCRVTTLSLTIRVYLHSFRSCWLITSKICEIPRNYPHIRPYSTFHSRLKTHLFHKSFPSESTYFSGRPSRSWTCTELTGQWRFYRAMHFSAKRGLAIACRLSVCPSVCPSVTLVDCDHIGWNSSEIFSPLVSLGCSLSAGPNIMGLLQGNTRFWPKVTCWFERLRHSIANCSRMVTDSATVTMESL